MHIQGYFRERLNSRQRGELRDVILHYRAGLLPIPAPLTLLKHYPPSILIAICRRKTIFDPYPQAFSPCARVLINRRAVCNYDEA